MLATRIITSDACPKCKFYIKALDRQNYKFDQYNADLKSNQKQLDEWHVTSMPVVQIIEQQDKGDPVVWFQFGPGQISPRSIELKKTLVMKQREKKMEHQETLRQMESQKAKAEAAKKEEE